MTHCQWGGRHNFIILVLVCHLYSSCSTKYCSTEWSALLLICGHRKGCQGKVLALTTAAGQAAESRTTTRQPQLQISSIHIYMLSSDSVFISVCEHKKDAVRSSGMAAQRDDTWTICCFPNLMPAFWEGLPLLGANELNEQVTVTFRNKISLWNKTPYLQKWHANACLCTCRAHQPNKALRRVTVSPSVSGWFRSNLLEVLEALVCPAALHFPAKHKPREVLNTFAKMEMFMKRSPKKWTGSLALRYTLCSSHFSIWLSQTVFKIYGDVTLNGQTIRLLYKRATLRWNSSVNPFTCCITCTKRGKARTLPTLYKKVLKW